MSFILVTAAAVLSLLLMVVGILFDFLGLLFALVEIKNLLPAIGSPATQDEGTLVLANVSCVGWDFFCFFVPFLSLSCSICARACSLTNFRPSVGSAVEICLLTWACP